MKSQLDRITVIPGLCNGKPIIRDYALLCTLLSHSAARETEQELFEAFPILGKEDITAALEYPVIN